MTNVEFVANRNWHTQKRHDLADKKALEYTDGKDRHSNFKRIADELNSSSELVLAVYALKHRDGILSWLRGRRNDLTEDVRGRIYDLQNYLDLLLAMVDEDGE